MRDKRTVTSTGMQIKGQDCAVDVDVGGECVRVRDAVTVTGLVFSCGLVPYPPHEFLLENNNIEGIPKGKY